MLGAEGRPGGRVPSTWNTHFQKQVSDAMTLSPSHMNTGFLEDSENKHISFFRVKKEVSLSDCVFKFSLNQGGKKKTHNLKALNKTSPSE